MIEEWKVSAISKCTGDLAGAEGKMNAMSIFHKIYIQSLMLPGMIYTAMMHTQTCLACIYRYESAYHM